MMDSGDAVTTEDPLGAMVAPFPDNPNQVIARDGMMLRVLVGSGVHGTSVEGQDDIDEMGICVEPTGTVIGLGRFEHYTYRTQPEGVCSGPGDLDLVVYGLRKYARLVAAGNPTVLLPLFIGDEHVRYITTFGQELRNQRNMFLSKQAGARFKGYLHSQRQGLMGLRSGGTRNQGRADIRARYGFDCKFAMHMVRLGLQGVELLETGAITLPIPEPHLTWLRELRRGEHSKQEALDWALLLESQIDELMITTELPPQPNFTAINKWLISVHQRHWSGEE